MVTTTTPGVLKPRTMSFAESLRNAGHDVRLVVCTDVSVGITKEFDSRARQQLVDRGFPVDTVEVEPPPRTHMLRTMVARGASSEVAAYSSPRLSNAVRALLDGHDPDVIHVDRMRALEVVGRLDRPTVLDLTDPRGFLGGPQLRADIFLHRETVIDTARQVADILPARHEELSASQRMQCLTASEESARAMIQAGAPAENVTAVPNATTRSTRAAPTRGSGGPRARLAMTGNYRYPPNVLAVYDLQAALAASGAAGVESTLLIGARGSNSAMRSARRMGFRLVLDVDSVPRSLVSEQVDVCVAPHTVIRGFPNRVVDAVYFAGKPIIVSVATARMLPRHVADALAVLGSPGDFGAVLADVTRRGAAFGELVEKAQGAIESACDESVVAAALERAYRRAARQ